MLLGLSLFPLLGMVGGALDMSRAYLVKTRLQHACDAAVLSGRRAMTGSTFDPAARAAADSYFNLNFSRGRYGSTGLSMTYDVGTDMIVHGMAAVSVPTSIMKVFGKESIPLQSTCEAQLQLPNSDIMFVLDTTLSMGETNPGDSTAKIAELRTSVQSFYATLENARSGSAQVRYGFVPYSSTVNVGMLLKRDWMVDAWEYQSREKAEVEDVTSGATGATTTEYTPWEYKSGSKTTVVTTLPSESCTAATDTWKSSSVNGPYTVSTQSNGDVWKTRTVVRTLNGSGYTIWLANGVCTQTETRYDAYVEQQTETVKPNPKAGQTTTYKNYWWNYKPVSYPVALLKGTRSDGLMAGGSFVAALNNDHSNRTITWNAASACIEERQATSPSNGLPGYDMDVDMIPNMSDPRTQWRPSLSQVVYARSVNNYWAPTGWSVPAVHVAANYVNLSDYPNDRAACPAASRKLSAITSTALETYLQTLKPAGYTYHDVGFLWGLRLLSAQGLFASENTAAANGGSITRNLIFMTDGNTETNIADYDAYGLSALDRRRTEASRLPTADEQNTLVEDRLLRLCEVAKTQKNITVWVIAFGTSLTSMLTKCASDGRAYQADNALALHTTFAEIAARISQLRVTH